MAAAPSQSYLRTKVLTASPGELRLMLLDGAIRFAEQAKAGYLAKDFEKSFEGTTKCQAILNELLCALRPDQSPELCSRLAGLYTYMYGQMVTASSNRSPETVEEVLKLLRYERETWVMVLERTAASGDLSSTDASDSAAAARP